MSSCRVYEQGILKREFRIPNFRIKDYKWYRQPLIILVFAVYFYNISLNEAAWPYYYLAEHMVALKYDSQLKDIQKNNAYVHEKDYFEIQPHEESFIKLKEFSFGKMVFDYYGKSENFLVVADAWHLYWRAFVDNAEIPVAKANLIFKGVRLPSGDHTVSMEFDTSLYRPGIYISLIAWPAFFILWLWFWVREKRLEQIQ